MAWGKRRMPNFKRYEFCSQFSPGTSAISLGNDNAGVRFLLGHCGTNQQRYELAKFIQALSLLPTANFGNFSVGLGVSWWLKWYPQQASIMRIFCFFVFKHTNSNFFFFFAK